MGYPLPLRLTGGERHAITQATALIDGYECEHVLADRGYHADDFVAFILDQHATPVLPSMANRKPPRAVDRWPYRERPWVECFMNKIKHFRRLFSRFEKLATRFLGFLNFVCALIWVR